MDVCDVSYVSDASMRGTMNELLLSMTSSFHREKHLCPSKIAERSRSGQADRQVRWAHEEEETLIYLDIYCLRSLKEWKNIYGSRDLKAFSSTFHPKNSQSSLPVVLPLSWIRGLDVRTTETLLLLMACKMFILNVSYTWSLSISCPLLFHLIFLSSSSCSMGQVTFPFPLLSPHTHS